MDLGKPLKLDRFHCLRYRTIYKRLNAKTKIEMGNLAFFLPFPVKLSALFKNILKLWEEEYKEGKARIKMETIPEDPTVFLDEEQMASTVIKLMQNSASAMPNGGTITISNCWEGNCLVISVTDNGAGIDPEDLSRIFDPFFTTKPQGSGLGLTTVNRVVSNHGGQVKVSTNLGAGTEVKLYIPR